MCCARGPFHLLLELFWAVMAVQLPSLTIMALTVSRRGCLHGRLQPLQYLLCCLSCSCATGSSQPLCTWCGRRFGGLGLTLEMPPPDKLLYCFLSLQTSNFCVEISLILASSRKNKSQGKAAWGSLGAEGEKRQAGWWCWFFCLLRGTKNGVCSTQEMEMSLPFQAVLMACWTQMSEIVGKGDWLWSIIHLRWLDGVEGF